MERVYVEALLLKTSSPIYNTTIFTPTDHDKSVLISGLYIKKANDGIIINFEEAAQKKVEEIKNKLKEEKRSLIGICIRTYERPMESRDQHFSNRYIQVDAKRNENNLSSKESEPTGEVRITKKYFLGMIYYIWNNQNKNFPEAIMYISADWKNQAN
ncbi:hypothetical protein RhiirA4_526687 [Rhizophagus irregularis]|uniref:Uncharacterized protein n=1 Tax=Rhizophagus irregularis TaxID=588596 RepID=A0A2I1FTE0_9GLOM|nr:hypothetical protein RhiirA4_526687 [Rhizophagus irregularis]